MTPFPLLSSNQITNALKRAEFQPGRKAKGDHQAYIKDMGDRKIITIVVLGRKEVPRKTLKSILKLAEMTLDEFMKYVK